MWKKPNLSLLNFFLGFFSSSNLDFFFWKKKPNFQIWFFFISEKKTKFEFGLFLLWIWIFSEENTSDMYQKQFSSEKVQIHKRKRQNSNLVFFSEIKKTKFGNLVFFSEKKIQIWRRKKTRKNLVKLKFGFFHMDGANVGYKLLSIYVCVLLCMYI